MKLHTKLRMKLRHKRKIIYAVVVLLIMAAAVFFGHKALSEWEEDAYEIEPAEEVTLSYEDEKIPLIYYDGAWYSPKKNLETVLIMGLDKYEDELAEDDAYQNDQRADFLLLLVLDHDAERFTSIHLNRDTMAAVPVLAVDGTVARTTTEQLTLAHTYGSGKWDSCENTVKAVSDLLYSIEIDHFVSLTMDAVAKVNDRAGGVRIRVMDDFSAVDPTLVQGEEVTLKGKHALNYVRSRRGLEDSTNIRRMERQRQYLDALFCQVKYEMEEDSDFFMETVMSISEYLVSDCTASQLSQISEAVIYYENEGIQTIDGESVRGTYMEFYPDEKALRDLVLQTFYEVSADYEISAEYGPKSK